MWTRLLRRMVGTGIREVTGADLEAELRSGAPPVLIDIRNTEQFAAGHLPGAVWIPLDRLALGAASLQRSAPTVVY